jgi:hypothetical protein
MIEASAPSTGKSLACVTKWCARPTGGSHGRTTDAPAQGRGGAKRRPRLGGCLRKAQAREKPGPMWMGNSKAPGLAINQIVSDCTYEEG